MKFFSNIRWLVSLFPVLTSSCNSCFPFVFCYVVTRCCNNDKSKTTVVICYYIKIFWSLSNFPACPAFELLKYQRYLVQKNTYIKRSRRKRPLEQSVPIFKGKLSLTCKSKIHLDLIPTEHCKQRGRFIMNHTIQLYEDRSIHTREICLPLISFSSRT